MTLRVAIPNKGSLSVNALQLMVDAGYKAHRNHRELRVTDIDNDITFFFQRPKDIATYVGSGQLDVGITGTDLLVNSGAPAEAILELGFAHAQFRFAAAPGAVNTVEELRGKRVATSFPNLVAKYVADRGIETGDLVTLDGAVENAIELGVADAIADVVETGESLRGAGLVPFGEPLMVSQAILIQSTRRPASDIQTKAITGLTNRLKGVLNSRQYVIMDYDCPTTVQAQACLLTPGMESPTISPLGKGGWVAIRALVPNSDVQSIMDQLEDIGCRAILVTPLRACRI
jgi:ATP phosphoribosyltransferase